MSRNVMLWQTFLQFFGIKDQTGFKIRKNVRKKSYNKYIFIIVTWSGVQYHISWMRLYHWMTRDAISGDLMVCCNPLDLKQYARSSYYYDKVYLSPLVGLWYVIMAFPGHIHWHFLVIFTGISWSYSLAFPGHIHWHFLVIFTCFSTTGEYYFAHFSLGFVYLPYFDIPSTWVETAWQEIWFGIYHNQALGLLN